MVFYNGSEEEGRANFKPFFDLSKLFIRLAHLTLHVFNTPLIEYMADLTKEIPYEELNGAQVRMVSVPLIYQRLISSERRSWSRTVPSSQKFIAHQASFTLSQESARSISCLGRLRSSSHRRPGLFPSQEDPEHSQWYLRKQIHWRILC